MADANRVQVSTLEEKTWGTTNGLVGTILVNDASQLAILRSKSTVLVRQH